MSDDLKTDRQKSQILRRERRSVFWVWTVLASLAVVVALFANPLGELLNVSSPTLAIAIPAIEILLLAIGLGWLLRVVFRGRARAREELKPD